MSLLSRIGILSSVLRRSVTITSSLGNASYRTQYIVETTRSRSSATALEDPYPSRAGKNEVLPRVDPVIWTQNGASPDGPLTIEQLGNYRERGYLVIDNVFTADEIKPLQDEVKRHQYQIENNIGEDEDPTITEDTLFSTEPTTRKLRSIFGPHMHFSPFERMSRSEKLVSRVKQIVADDVYIHQSRVNLHLALLGTGHFWHSDFEIFHTEDGMPRMRALTCVVMLGMNTPQQGCLMVVPESHKVFIPTAKSTPKDNLAKSSKFKIEYGAPDEVVFADLVSKHGIDYCTGQAGSVVLFDINTLHGNQNNLSPLDRVNLFLVYNSVGNKVVKPYSAPWDKRPEHMGARDLKWVQPIKPIANLLDLNE